MFVLDTGILADLLRAVGEESDQLQVGMVDDRAQGMEAHVAG